MFLYRWLKFVMRPLTSSHVNSWSNSLRRISCSRKSDSNLKMYSMKLNTIYWSHKLLQLRSFTHQKCIKNFLFLQYSGLCPWYVLLHSPSAFENDLSCVVFKIGRPEGNTSHIIVEAYSTRWVQISTNFFTAILSR